MGHLNDLIASFPEDLNASFVNKDLETLSFIRTGLPSLDFVLGKGIPFKHITEIYGPSGSGKTSLAYKLMQEGQKQGYVLYIDSDHAFDLSYAKKVGVKKDSIIVMQPSSADQIMNVLPELLNNIDISLVIVDTVCGVIPEAELDNEFSENYKSLLGPFWKQAVPKILTLARRTNTAFVLLNQVRDHIGMSKKIATNIGSIASKAIIRCRTESVSTLVRDGETFGERILFSIEKNLLGISNKNIELDLYYDKGFSTSSSLFELAFNLSIITRRGTWFFYKDTALGQGKLNCIESIDNSMVIMNNITKDVLECQKK